MKIIESINAWGHKNVTGMSRRTFEITKEDWLTKRGDCILAVKASKGSSDLSSDFKKFARKQNANIKIMINVGKIFEEATGKGSPYLTFTHNSDIVCRKSNFICSRTLMIKSNKSAIDFSRDLIMMLKNPEQKVKITLIITI